MNLAEQEVCTNMLCFKICHSRDLIFFHAWKLLNSFYREENFLVQRRTIDKILNGSLTSAAVWG